MLLALLSVVWIIQYAIEILLESRFLRIIGHPAKVLPSDSVYVRSLDHYYQPFVRAICSGSQLVMVSCAKGLVYFT